MKMKKAFILFLVLAGLAFGYSGGDGSSGNPYQIATTTDLIALSADTAHWNKYFKQTANLDFSSAGSISPVGVSGTFTGEYDGQGYTISNITFASNAANAYGLFALTGTEGGTNHTAVVKNVNIIGGIVNANTQSGTTSSYIGFIVAENASNCLVTNCTVTNCTVAYTHAVNNRQLYLGQVIGANHGIVSYCSVSGGSITAASTHTGGSYNCIGGVVGYQLGDSAGAVGYISHCTSSTTITCNDNSAPLFVGGIAGFMTNDNGAANYIENSAFSGTINIANTTSNAANYIGGVCGECRTIVRNSSSQSTITSNTVSLTAIGGVIGHTHHNSQTNLLDIDTCFANSTISANYSSTIYVGGFLGFAEKNTPVNDCYALGTLVDLKEGAGNKLNFSGSGGFSGRVMDSSAITNCWTAISMPGRKTGNTRVNVFAPCLTGATTTKCFWNSSLCGDAYSADELGGDCVAKTTTELKTKTTYSSYILAPTTSFKWKMATPTTVSPPDVGTMYPILSWQADPYLGAGTAGNPYRIKTTLDWVYAYENAQGRATGGDAYFQLDKNCSIGTLFMILKKSGSGGDSGTLGAGEKLLN